MFEEMWAKHLSKEQVVGFMQTFIRSKLKKVFPAKKIGELIYIYRIRHGLTEPTIRDQINKAINSYKEEVMEEAIKYADEKEVNRIGDI